MAEDPICPYCEKTVNWDNIKSTGPRPLEEKKKGTPSGWISERVIYYCPHCGKILGVALSSGRY